MSKIGFRVWDKENNKFWEDINEAYDGKIEQLLISPGGDICIRKMDGMYHESLFPDRFVVQQYTGMKDHYDNDIYEGDVLKVTNLSLGRFSDKERYVNDVVIFVGGQFTGSNWNIRESYCEIIGNIYWNPELLNL